MNHHHTGARPAIRPLAIAVAAIAAATTVPGVAEARAAASRSAAANWNATVIATDADRGRLVTAGRGGEVRTVVASRRVAGRTRPGQRLAVRARRSADGTYEARRLRVTGRARRTRIRGAAVERRAGRYLLSAGGSVFSVQARGRAVRRAHASTAVAGSGDVVVTDVRIAGERLEEQRTRDVGDVAVLELEGIFLGLENGVLSLAVEKRGLVQVAVPAGLALSAPATGDEVELLVSIGSGGFTLVALDDDDEHGIDFDGEDGEAEIEGVIGDLTDAALTVEGHGGATLTCAIPAGATLIGFAEGDAVEMECAVTAHGFVLHELESETAEFELDDDDEHDDDEDEDEDDD